MKTHYVMATLAAAFLGCSSVLAQTGGMATSPLNATSPLAIGPGSSVGPTGIPLGATEMTMPGTSPAPPSTMSCSSAGGPTSQTATPLFDGGMTGAASSACAATGSAGAGNAGSSMPPISTLQLGRANIPLGSTEMGSAGLSPPPPVSTMFVSPIVPPTAAPLSTMGSPPSTGIAPPCPVTGTFPDGTTTRQARSSSSAGTTIVPGC